MNLADIASLVNGTLIGNPEYDCTGVNDLKSAAPHDITFLAYNRYQQLLETTQAGVVLISSEIDYHNCSVPVIICEDASVAFDIVCEHLFPEESFFNKGIHETATIASNCDIDISVSIGAHVHISSEVSIGANTSILPSTVIGQRVVIGTGCRIGPNVSILSGTTIGNNVIIHAGTVIGSDGFGFSTDDNGIHHKIRQFGIVEIGNDVEIGSCVTIDRARFGITTIGDGTKIDNLVQIAHNCHIGKNCLIVSQVGLSGSTTVGNNVIMAGRSGSFGHVHIGDNAVITAVSVVSKDIPEGQRVSGIPARPSSEHQRSEAVRLRLPQLLQRIKVLEKKVHALE